jgi:hypothetical protein
VRRFGAAAVVGGWVWWFRRRRTRGGFDPHARDGMSTWLDAQLSGPPGNGPSAFWPGSGRPLLPHAVGCTCSARGWGWHCSRMGVTPDLSGAGPHVRARVCPNGAGDGPVGWCSGEGATASIWVRVRVRCGRRGGLFGGVEAACASSYVLGELTKPGVGCDKSGRSGAWGPGADPAPTRCSSMRTMSWAPLLSATVATSRFSRAGVHYPDMVSIGGPVGLRARPRVVGGGELLTGWRQG